MNILDTIQQYLSHREVAYLLLILVIFIVPKLFQRYGLPAAISSFGIGAATALGLGWFVGDDTIKLLATLGIVSLFLHAGLDVSLPDLRKNARILSQHVALFVLLLAIVAWTTNAVTDLSWRASTILALALVTPSTGFILDSITALPLTDSEREGIRHKSIAAELVALVVLFFTMQTFSLQTFLISLAVILTLILLVPLLLKFFARQVAPFAPNSEFAFLIVLALLCAFVTKQIGTYYLVGAFLVGVAAQQFQRQLPTAASKRLIGAVELFASFFVPFYFFHSGTLLTRDDISLNALWLALAAIAVVLPLRVAMVVVHRRVALSESIRRGLRVSVPMLPTLVFTLVLAQLLREHFALDSRYYGALIIYAIASSLAASFIFKSPEPDFSGDLLRDGLDKIVHDPPSDHHRSTSLNVRDKDKGTIQ